MLKDIVCIIPRRRFEDSRGWFVKPIDGNEKDMSNKKCEIYVTSANPGQSKGGDYSLTTNKWFTLIKGQATLVLEDIKTKERILMELDSQEPKTIYVPCMIANILQNKGNEESVLVVYADKQYDKNDIIQYEL